MMDVSTLLDALGRRPNYKKAPNVMGTINNLPKTKRPDPPPGYKPKITNDVGNFSGSSKVKPISTKRDTIGYLSSDIESKTKAICPKEVNATPNTEVSTISVGDRVVPSKIDKGKIPELLSQFDIPSNIKFIVGNVLGSINFDDINSILNSTKDLNETNKKVLDTLLNNNLDSEKQSVLDDLSTIKKWMKLPSWFDSFFFGIKIEDHLNKIDTCVDNLIKKTNIIKKDIKKIDEQSDIVSEQLNQIDARITSCDIILVLLDGEFKKYKGKYYDVITKLKSNMMISKQLMMKDPIIVKLSRDNLFNLIQSIEFDIFVLIHEWKTNLKLKKFQTDADIKKMMSDIQKKIVTEIGR